MYDDGYRNIENIDISKVCIEQMQEKYKDRSMNCAAARALPCSVLESRRPSPKRMLRLAGRKMDVCSLEYPDEAFDVVLDKGTLDSILCGEGSTSNVSKMCNEISRCVTAASAPSVAPLTPARLPSVLKANGAYVVISYGIPDNRLSYLDNAEFGWKVDVQTIRARGRSPHALPLHP